MIESIRHEAQLENEGKRWNNCANLLPHLRQARKLEFDIGHVICWGGHTCARPENAKARKATLLVPSTPQKVYKRAEGRKLEIDTDVEVEQ
jgi:hypothetical protein